MAFSPERNREHGRGKFLSRAHRPDTAHGEWEMLQEILRPSPSPIAQEYLVHYYISAKTWPLVLIIGRPGVGKRRLFRLLAGGIAGCSAGQVHLLPSQPRWRQHTGQAKYFGSIQSRFNTMTFVDLLAEAATPGNEGQAYFLGLDQSTAQELTEYMDLYMGPPGRPDGPPALPANLHVTAILSTTARTWQVPPALLDRVGIVEVSVPLGTEEPLPEVCPPVGWQRLFLRSAVREADLARRRLQSLDLLSSFHHLLAPLRGPLGDEMGTDWTEALLLYASNSFTADGTGLLEKTATANLRQAIDLQLAQRLLPCLAQRPTWTGELWEQLLERLDGTFPLAHARARRILLQRTAAQGPGGKEAQAEPLTTNDAPPVFTSISDLRDTADVPTFPTPPSLSAVERGRR